MNHQEIDTEVKVELDIIQNIFQLGRRSEVVPVGCVFVLSYGYEFADAGGLPEVYLAGEVVTRDPLRKRQPCWAIQLAEFPGRVDIRASRVLAGISRSEDDPASMAISFYVRLHDPILLLRRTGGKWERGNLSAFNQQVNKDVTEWLQALLERDLQIWSGDEQEVLTRIFSELDQYLRRIGLRVDTTEGGHVASAVIFVRHYPPALYDLAFQFAKAERLLRRGTDVSQETGLSEEEIRFITSSEERAGVAFFQVLRRISPEVRERVVQWMERFGMPDAAFFLKALYKYPDREIKLSEQVLLAAIRNPWLTRGEWIKEMSESPATRFQQIERRVKSLLVGS